jgi:hypothetical protein
MISHVVAEFYANKRLLCILYFYIFLFLSDNGENV